MSDGPHVVRPAVTPPAGGLPYHPAPTPPAGQAEVMAALARIEGRLDRLDQLVHAAVGVLPLPLRMKLGRALNGTHTGQPTRTTG